MKNINVKKFATILLTTCAVIFGMTMITTAAVNPALISKSQSGSNGDADSRNISVSADGRFIVFESDATNLISGLTDTNNGADIFLRDTKTGTLRCISLANPTTTGNSLSINPVISLDGRYVVFASKASDFVALADTNFDFDVFRFDTAANQFQLISVNAAGTGAGNAFSGNSPLGWRTYDMSDNGRFVAFMSNASDLSGISDANNVSDVYVRDTQSGITRLVSFNQAGTAAGNSESVSPSISGDGNLIAYTSGADNLIPVDNNNSFDSFIYNVETQSTKCISLAISGNAGTGSLGSYSPIISKNGARVAFFSEANNITNTPIPLSNPFRNVFVYDIGLNFNSLVSINTAGNAAANEQNGNGIPHQMGLSISANGRYIAFESKAANLVVSTPTAGTYNVFRRDLLQAKTELVSLNAVGSQSGNGTSLLGVRGSAMSADGRFIAFTSVANNLVSDYPGNSLSQIYVRDMVNSVTTALTLNSAGNALSTGGKDLPSISAGGRAVVFSSVSADLTPTAGNNTQNIYKSFVPTPQKPVADFDGDGLSDFAVFRPQLNGIWYVFNNSATFASYRYYGAGTDLITPADFTGDGRTDYAVFRPSNSTWYISDENFSETIVQFGQTGDTPIPQDFDGDGKADVAIFRNGTWWWQSSQNGQATSYQFGLAGDIPVQGDFDGDGRGDYAVFRPSNGTWYAQKSSSGSVITVNFGLAGDKPVAADYDGDGKTDIAVFRAGTWYILNSRDNSVGITQFGLATDIPVPGSYDGDGKADIAVFRPSEGNWYMLRSTNNAFAAVHFGQTGDAPVPAAFIP
jgi:hypothetical protein